MIPQIVGFAVVDFNFYPEIADLFSRRHPSLPIFGTICTVPDLIHVKFHFVPVLVSSSKSLTLNFHKFSQLLFFVAFPLNQT